LSTLKQNSTINKFTILKTATVILLLSLAGVIALLSTVAYRRSAQGTAMEQNSRHSDGSDALQLSSRFQHNFSAMISGLRGYLTTREVAYIQTYDSALLENKKIMAAMSARFKPSSDQHIILDDIKQLQTYWVDEFAKPLIRAKEETAQYSTSNRSFESMYKAKVATGLENDIQNGIQNKFKEFASIENESQHQAFGRLINRFADSRMKFNLLVGSAMILGIAGSGWLAWYIKGRIKRAGDSHLIKPTRFDEEETTHEIAKINNRQLEPEEIISKLRIAHIGKTARDKKEVVDIEEILETIRDTVLSRSDITIHFTSPMPVLYTERLVLEQLLTNLIGNTIDFTGRRNTINFWWTSDKEFYQFYIQHHMASNPGGERALPRLDAMNAIHDVNEFEVGLSLVKKIIHERGLDLRINLADSSSVFCFTWPKNEFNETHY
jgi:CHASE3 domain sensor protein